MDIVLIIHICTTYFFLYDMEKTGHCPQTSYLFICNIFYCVVISPIGILINSIINVIF